MRSFIYSIFIGAFLLFQVQPMIAKMILPWFGGTEAVWATCMLFFQTGLLIGYSYAHMLSRASMKIQVIVHLILLLISLGSMPFMPKEWMAPGIDENPVTAILRILMLSVGLPYMLISATGPLVQSWFAKANPKKSPYRLYAFSNMGSLVGLLSFPFIIEPTLHLSSQSWFWTFGYLLYIVLMGIIGWSMAKVKITTKDEAKTLKKEEPGLLTMFFWIALSCLGVIAMLSFTNKLTQDIIVMPFLWSLLLAIYLITFIIAFNSARWYKRALILPLLLMFIGFILKRQVNNVVYDKELSVSMTIMIYSLCLFLLCMALHGELSRLKPHSGKLTKYYLFLSIGGVLGGIFVGLLVPMIFDGYWEIYCALFGGIILLAAVLLNEKSSDKKISPVLVTGIALITLGGISYSLYREYRGFYKYIIVSERNFYGALKISELYKGTNNWQRTLVHGDVIHGMEFMQPENSRVPLAYYGPNSGVGLVLTRYPTRNKPDFQGMKVGAIGLGTGTIATYATPKDVYRFYELNPLVEKLARKYFKYLEESPGKVEVVIGDGRIALEKDYLEKGPQDFDVIVVDAFAGDIIPAHLITLEAGQLYMNNLKKDGMLAFHISNNYVDLMPVIAGMAEKLNLYFYYFFQAPDPSGPIEAAWVILTNNKEWANNPKVKEYEEAYDPQTLDREYWTDDYSAVWRLVRAGPPEGMQ